jgi:hypothetical protein
MMQVVNQYAFAPGQCRICGGAKVPAVDTGLEMDTQGFDGRLYFCHDCVTSMYSMISGTLGSPGMVPSHRFAELQGRVELAEQQAQDYREALDALRGDTPIGQEFRRVAEILSRMADDQDSGQPPVEAPAEPVTPSSAAAPDLASLPPHPSEEELAAAQANARIPEVPSAAEQAALVAAHMEADRAQRGDQRTDPGADLGVAPPVATALDPNDPDAARLRDDQTARFEDQQARADAAQSELDALQHQVIDDEAARQSPSEPVVDPADERQGTPVPSPADDAVVPSSVQPVDQAEPATVPTDDVDPGEAEPFPAPAADSVEPADEAPPVPADDDATPEPAPTGTDESLSSEVAVDDPAAIGETPAEAATIGETPTTTTKRSRKATS